MSTPLGTERRGRLTARRSRLLRLVLGATVVAAATALVASPAAAALDVVPVPEELRTHPVTPTFDAQHQPRDRQVTSDGLTSTGQPDYGSSAPVGDPIRTALNADANAAGAEIRDKADALEADDESGDDALRRCVEDGLWDMLFNAVWDAVHDHSFNLGSEINKATSAAAQCIADRFHVRPLVAASVSDWMMESVISHGADVIARDPTVAAFVNWAAVMAWYSI